LDPGATNLYAMAGGSTRPDAFGALLLAVALLASCERTESGLRLRGESIGHLGSGYAPGSLVVSHDHRHFAWIDRRGGRCRVVADRERGPFFAQCANPLYSPDGKILAYWASSERSDPPKVQLVANGHRSDVVVANQGPIAFGAKGGWAAAAQARSATLPAPSGEVKPSPAATGEEPQPSPAATAVWASPSPAPKEGATLPRQPVVVFDASGVLGEHPDTTSPVVSPDGEHVAYIAADEEHRQRLFVDGKVRRDFGRPEGAHLPAIKPAKEGPNLEPETTLHYLSDGTLAGVALGEAGWTVFHEDEVWAAYPAIHMPPEAPFQVDDPTLRESSGIVAGSFTVAEDAPMACWWERMAGEVDRWRVLCNGKPIDSQTCEVQSPGVPISIAANGGGAAYVCRSTPQTETTPDPAPKNLWIVVNGERQGPHRFVWGVSLSPDGKHYGYAAADSLDEPWFYVIDGKRHDGPWQQTFPPRFSADGKTAVWAASGDEEGRRVDLVIGGNIVTRAELIMKPPLFLGSGEDLQVQWAVKRGKSVRRVIASGLGEPIGAAEAIPDPHPSQGASLDSPRPPS
jgi:hypothetical protein